MYAWSDIDKVKKDLWKKLHSVKNVVATGATNLAQTVQKHALTAASAIHKRLPEGM
jgi:hypothetical protein